MLEGFGNNFFCGVFQYGVEEYIMQKLSNVPFHSLRIGDRVKSSHTGNEGMIYKLIPIEQSRRFDDNEIIIKWDTGSISYQWQYCFDGVWLM